MLSDLGWPKLADRRRDLRLSFLSKEVKGQVAVSSDPLGLVKADNRTRSSNPYKFKTIYSQIPLNIRILLYKELSLTGINFLVILYLLRVWLPKIAKNQD